MEGKMQDQIEGALSQNERLSIINENLVEALSDMLSGWQYIRLTHGDLPGVGWDRAQHKAVRALAKARGEQ